MPNIETFLYEISKYFLTPVLVILLVMFVISLFYLGMLLVELVVRASGKGKAGELTRYAQANPWASQDVLELHLLKRLEVPRIISRVAPMLGLVATMIPMGPALVSVSSGNTQGIASNLVVAFSAVIVALLAAAITFTVLSIRRRWLLEELNAVLDMRSDAHAPKDDQPVLLHVVGGAHG